MPARTRASDTPRPRRGGIPAIQMLDSGRTRRSAHRSPTRIVAVGISGQPEQQRTRMLSRRSFLAGAGGAALISTNLTQSADASPAAAAEIDLKSLAVGAKPISAEERLARIAKLQSLMTQQKVKALSSNRDHRSSISPASAGAAPSAPRRPSFRPWVIRWSSRRRSKSPRYASRCKSRPTSGRGTSTRVPSIRSCAACATEASRRAPSRSNPRFDSSSSTACAARGTPTRSCPAVPSCVRAGSSSPPPNWH